ncbi:uncharacterized protein LOC126896370 isoform X2 [Daktulosphaira vitifoliae]|uniref:uncharacterized protein LOC126896370 isoform X2 n=1 Tax=Daktulosphaira vitifoliae TaxID=58002 RepID=UPI0021AAD4D6|nr:uncharacterized protein LOC126896370 isoform X2 [Daktulosphaira vitifoliae]
MKIFIVLIILIVIYSSSCEEIDQGFCVVCQDDNVPLTVILNNCRHSICNYCANEMEAREVKNCPLCRTKIDKYENLVELPRCICKKELPSVVLSPCGHLLGNDCAIKYKEEEIPCPNESCGKHIEKFKDLVVLKNCDQCDDEQLTVVLQPCGHMLGNRCAVSNKKLDKPCPFCNQNVSNYEGLFDFTLDDEEEMLFESLSREFDGWETLPDDISDYTRPRHNRNIDQELRIYRIMRHRFFLSYNSPGEGANELIRRYRDDVSRQHASEGSEFQNNFFSSKENSSIQWYHKWTRHAFLRSFINCLIGH